MTPTEQQILALLARRREIDRSPDGFPVKLHSRWLIEAVTLLLQHQLDLREELRNAGILR